MIKSPQTILGDQRWRNVITGELWTGRQVFLRIVGFDSPVKRRDAIQVMLLNSRVGAAYRENNRPIFKRTK